ncbi:MULTISPECIES: peptidoglycan D,D-transpeptidase FtsI family protein [unclassified Deinococcus]|uniref:peptidoglycan D,D-transpeptidase FtsI family protein n=1 Tax=unclassified Deinococcus TaxID=2623546 RepID=UPI001C2FD552|nr:penicillin-binding transpeptidase domain-containing protein [Deinococcus sp. 43]MDK2011325.1 penicillin-binding transpeptidase domain-containing protein [Deinococcus sp. 43]
MSRADRVWDRRDRLRRRAGAGLTAPRVAGGTRVQKIALGFSVALALLGVRLYYLQVSLHDQFAVRSASNYQRDEVLRALRGEIRTRDGVLLATNRLAVDLVYTGRLRKSERETPIPGWDKIVYLAGIGGDVLVGGQPREPDYEREPATVLARNIPQERLAALYEYTVLVPSLELRERVERVYPQGKMAAHLLGYVQEASESQVKEDGYTQGDLVGRSGLEYSLQKTLEGKNGLRRREVTAAGKPQTERVIDPGVKGKDVTLSIDSLLQRTAETALREGLADVNRGRAKFGKAPEPYARGAVIALDPRTNEVLALASAPTYDPNWFSRVPSPDPKAKNWAIDPNRPLAELDAVTANRAVQAYAPGSVFKIATTLMQEERWGNFSLPCNPVYYFGRAPRKNWAGYPLGVVDGKLAISYSCNPWYYHSAASAGPERYGRTLVQRMKELGYLRPTGLEIVGEKLGEMRGPDEYTSPQDPWYPGFALNMSIGQGSVQVTPAQVAWVMSTIVNEGQQRPLTVLRSVAGKREALKPATSVVYNGKVDAFRFVKEGMSGTTAGTRYGTAQHEIGPDRFPVRTAGKTGTAENGTSSRQGYAYTHAWYEGYGPIGKDGTPTFAVVAFFQFGGEGSGPALRAVKRMFAARWCVTLDEKLSALPLAQQQPCTGELEQMHQVYKTRAERAKDSATKATPGAQTP